MQYQNRVDDIQHELDARIIDIIARQQPVASDLRALVTALRMSADLERMGDMAHHIAKITRLRHPNGAVPSELLLTIEEMGKVARLISDKVGGIINSRDIEKALEVERDDDEMDKLHRKLFTTLLDPKWPHGIETLRRSRSICCAPGLLPCDRQVLQVTRKDNYFLP
jgi:phosphate transport system protein